MASLDCRQMCSFHFQFSDQKQWKDQDGVWEPHVDHWAWAYCDNQVVIHQHSLSFAFFICHIFQPTHFSPPTFFTQHIFHPPHFSPSTFFNQQFSHLLIIIVWKYLSPANIFTQEYFSPGTVFTWHIIHEAVFSDILDIWVILEMYTCLWNFSPKNIFHLRIFFTWEYFSLKNIFHHEKIFHLGTIGAPLECASYIILSLYFWQNFSPKIK